MIEPGTLVQATIINFYGEREPRIGRVTQKRQSTPNSAWYAVEGLEKEVPEDRIHVIWNEKKNQFFLDYNRFSGSADGDWWFQQAAQQEHEAGITAEDWELFHELQTQEVDF